MICITKVYLLTTYTVQARTSTKRSPSLQKVCANGPDSHPCYVYMNVRGKWKWKCQRGSGAGILNRSFARYIDRHDGRMTCNLVKFPPGYSSSSSGACAAETGSLVRVVSLICAKFSSNVLLIKVGLIDLVKQLASCVGTPCPRSSGRRRGSRCRLPKATVQRLLAPWLAFYRQLCLPGVTIEDPSAVGNPIAMNAT